MKYFLSVIVLGIISGTSIYFIIQNSGSPKVKMEPPSFSIKDPSSFSRPDLAVVTFVNISLSVNFEKQIFHGNTKLTIKKVDKKVKEVILDAKDLNIESIYETDTNQKLNYTLSNPVGEFGSKLTVELPEKDNNIYLINITYETSPKASGLQWLEPSQTAGKKHPYVFSQFQAIHARTFLPCQDTPAVKTKYEALINAPSDLTVVMSAIGDDKKEMHGNTYYHFKQDVPVQSYLIAIAIGALESRKIGPRSTVWAEKEFIDAAEYEFANTEHQLKTAEDICGPYVWGIYDLLVLPPSFPFGGMENPCLTFVTPTLLAGDRTLANVVAHEIAHSWTGNLISNANFEHFWLNEGFTVFIERKIVGRLESSQVQDFEAYGGRSELQETINQMGKDNPLTSLVVDLKGVHPDDAFSRVPYEKGYIFLRYLESLVGGPVKFEPFLRNYFQLFKFKSIKTKDFKKYATTYFSDNENMQKVDWNTWLYSPGMPPIIPEYDNTLLKLVHSVKQRWLDWNDTTDELAFVNDEKALSSGQKIQLLQEIFEAEPQTINKLEAIEKSFKFNEVANAEIKFRWFRIGIKAKWDKVLEPALKWVTEVGRMKYIRPLYRDLYNWEEARPKAIETFKANRNNMMHVSAYTVAKDLHLVD